MNIRTIEKIIEKYKRDYFKVKQIEKFIKIYHFIKFSKIEVCVKLKEKEEIESNNKSIFSSISDLFSKKNEKENFVIENNEK